MARSGMPDDYAICPDCGERLAWNVAVRDYLHVLSRGCPARDSTDAE